MTPREIVLANLEHRDPPRPGLTFSGPRVCDMHFAGCPNPDGYTPRRWTEGKVEYYDDCWGNLWVRMVGGSVKGEIHQPALADWAQLDRLVPPRYDIPRLAEHFRQAFAQDPGHKFHVAAIGGWIFDNARYLRKMEVYFLDMAMYPDELQRLHALVAGVYEQRIHAAGQAQADAIMIGEDLGTQQGLLFSPAMFRSYFKAEYTRLMGLAHDYGMKVLMHSCGKNTDLLDDLIDCGVNAFQFDQPAVYDMPALAELFRRRRVALWSPVDIQRILPTGDRAYIEEQTRYLCRTFAGGLIMKDYPDLPGIGVLPEWDDWAYRQVCACAGL